ncbi:MAG: 30S ribosomal protein S17e [Desulfurococcaceae archaeon]
MGKVRTKLIKKTAKDLFTKHPEVFSEDFQHNKEVLREMMDSYSKRVRNKVAGYITRLVKLSKRSVVKQAEE